MESSTGPRRPPRRIGDEAEALVAERLTSVGWRVIARNLRVGRAELDIVAIDPGPPEELVIVEVRSRRSRAFGLPEESFGYAKRRHLREAIGRLLQAAHEGAGEGPLGMAAAAARGRRLRVDLVSVEPPDVVRHNRGVAL